MEAPNRVKEHRARRGLSQQRLAVAAGVSRQAIVSVEAGRSVPSVALALRLAAALRTSVEALFGAGERGLLEAELSSGEVTAGDTGRVAVGEVDDRWVAHPLALDERSAADAVVEGRAGAPRRVTVRPLLAPEGLRRNVLVAGCAPLLGAVAHRVGARFDDARVTWLRASSERALELLRARQVHVAGIHLGASVSPAAHLALVREWFPDERMLVVNLTRWRQGLVVNHGNPLGLRDARDLLRPGVRLARRDAGAGAQRLIAHLLAEQGVLSIGPGPLARDHAEVGQLVRWGGADTGVAIESVARELELDFVPLVEERFDLVLPEASATATPVRRLLDALDDRGFRTDLARLPGYDPAATGEVTEVEAHR